MLNILELQGTSLDVDGVGGVLGACAEFKGTSMGTPNREPQEYSRNIIGIYLPRSFLLNYFWGSH